MQILGKTESSSPTIFDQLEPFSGVRFKDLISAAQKAQVPYYVFALVTKTRANGESSRFICEASELRQRLSRNSLSSTIRSVEYISLPLFEQGQPIPLETIQTLPFASFPSRDLQEQFLSNAERLAFTGINYHLVATPDGTHTLRDVQGLIGQSLKKHLLTGNWDASLEKTSNNWNTCAHGPRYNFLA